MASKKTTSLTSPSTTSMIAWLALALALFALVAALDGTMLSKKTVKVRQTYEAVQVDKQLNTAKAKLEAAQMLIEAKDFKGAEAVLLEVRSDLKTASANLSGDAMTQWQELDAQLETLLGQVKTGAVGALGSVKKAITQLQNLILSL